MLKCHHCKIQMCVPNAQSILRTFNAANPDSASGHVRSNLGSSCRNSKHANATNCFQQGILKHSDTSEHYETARIQGTCLPLGIATAMAQILKQLHFVKAVVLPLSSPFPARRELCQPHHPPYHYLMSAECCRRILCQSACSTNSRQGHHHENHLDLLLPNHQLGGLHQLHHWTALGQPTQKAWLEQNTRLSMCHRRVGKLGFQCRYHQGGQRVHSWRCRFCLDITRCLRSEFQEGANQQTSPSNLWLVLLDDHLPHFPQGFSRETFHAMFTFCPSRFSIVFLLGLTILPLLVSFKSTFTPTWLEMVRVSNVPLLVFCFTVLSLLVLILLHKLMVKAAPCRGHPTIHNL